MRVVATVQARTGSSRLPGKVLRPIVGKPMLALQVERLLQSRLIDEVVIATSDKPQDDPIEQLARQLEVSCFRGSEDDVLSRIVGALKSAGADLHAEFMGDSPMPDPLIVDQVIGYFLKHADRYDYVSNALTITYPPGLDVYVYPADLLYRLEPEIIGAAEREHVDVHIIRQPQRYRLRNLEAPPALRMPDLHLEVDTQEDFDVISAIYEHFYPGNPGFGLAQVLDFIRLHPELAEHNRHVERRWKAVRNV